MQIQVLVSLAWIIDGQLPVKGSWCFSVVFIITGKYHVKRRVYYCWVRLPRKVIQNFLYISVCIHLDTQTIDLLNYLRITEIPLLYWTTSELTELRIYWTTVFGNELIDHITPPYSNHPNSPNSLNSTQFTSTHPTLPTPPTLPTQLMIFLLCKNSGQVGGWAQKSVIWGGGLIKLKQFLLE